MLYFNTQWPVLKQEALWSQYKAIAELVITFLVGFGSHLTVQGVMDTPNTFYSGSSQACCIPHHFQEILSEEGMKK